LSLLSLVKRACSILSRVISTASFGNLEHSSIASFADLHRSSKTGKTEKNTVEKTDDYYKNNSNDKHKWAKQVLIAKLTTCTVQQQKKKNPVPLDSVTQETQDGYQIF
jgi:hypothetical protein